MIRICNYIYSRSISVGKVAAVIVRRGWRGEGRKESLVLHLIADDDGSGESAAFEAEQPLRKYSCTN